MVAQEIELLEVLEAEAGSARGVDFDDAGDAERIGIGAGGLGGGRRWRREPARRAASGAAGGAAAAVGGCGLRPGHT